MNYKEGDIIRELDIELGYLRKRRDGILTFYPRPGINTANLKQLKEMLEACKDIQQGKPSPFFSDDRSLRGMNREEKEFVKETFKEFATAAAILVDSPYSRFFHNMLIYLYDPEIPFKVFGIEQEAIDWLKGYLPEGRGNRAELIERDK